MLPYFTEKFGNAASTTHGFGHVASSAVKAARESVAAAVGARASEIVFTSGATESNNLALFGVVERARRRGDHVVSVATEHKAVLDPLERLARRGMKVTLLPVIPNGERRAGWVEVERVADAIRDDTCLVSVMLANNEIGAIHPLAEIGLLCHQRGVTLHCDATQAVGRIPVDVGRLNVDLMSFSGHKMYGPKGIGGLYVRRRDPRVRIEPQIVGGGQEGGRRSGTLNVPGIVGMAKALELAVAGMDAESRRLYALRNRLFEGLAESIVDVGLNGPAVDDPALRLAGNLNVSFRYVDGEALLMSIRRLALSSGSACTSEDPAPSHVLRALGLSDDFTRSSVRFGLGRFNTTEEVDLAVGWIRESVERLRAMSSLA